MKHTHNLLSFLPTGATTLRSPATAAAAGKLFRRTFSANTKNAPLHSIYSIHHTTRHHAPPRPSPASSLYSRHHHPSTSPPRHNGCNSRNHLHPAAATADSIPNINDHNHLIERGSTLVPPSSTSPRPCRHSRVRLVLL
nr:hypothetical protein [Tanacetum cinerariifolium]